MGSVGRTLAMPTAGASWIQECGAVAASLSLSSLFPHSGSKSSSETENMTSSSYPRPGTLPTSMAASAPASQHPEAGNLATIMEDADSGTGSSDKENTAASSVQPEHSVEEYERASAISARKEEAKTRRRKKKKTASSTSLASNTFQELYRLTGEMLGQGAYASVQTCVNIYTEIEYAVKIIDKTVPTHSRSRVFKEIDLFHHCQGHKNIINLIEYFGEQDRFYLVFEKITGGQLLDRIASRKYFTEEETIEIIRDIAAALEFLHSKGIAHRDLKPENILCVYGDRLTPVKLCDFDLGSGIKFHSGGGSDTTPLLHTPVGSAEFMAPEIVEAFIEDTEEDFKYDKRCDLWSLGVMMYILLSGYPPFSGSCGQKCAWAQGGQCDLCQLNLFTNIQHGMFEFHPKEWSCVSRPAKDLIRRLLVKDAKKRLSARDVLNHEWIDNNNQSFLSTPAKIRKDNSAKQLSLACESVAAVNRVVLQHMSISILDCVSDNLVGLSASSDSMMMQRRKSLQKGQSLQLNRLNTKVLSIQDLVGPVQIVSPSC